MKARNEIQRERGRGRGRRREGDRVNKGWNKNKRKGHITSPQLDTVCSKEDLE